MTRKTLALTAIAALMAGPAAAQYYSPTTNQAYEDCKDRDTEDQVIGTTLGAVIGGVVGNEIESGEGTAIGAGAGAIAGNRIANRDCEKYLDPNYRDDAYYDGYDSEYVTYDVRSGQYIDTRTGEIVRDGYDRDDRYADRYEDRRNRYIRDTQWERRNNNQYIRYDARTGQYIDSRSGAVVHNGRVIDRNDGRYTRTDEYGRTIVTSTPRDARVAGSVEYNQNGMVRVVDGNGNVFYVSQADYDRYYR